jgi:hypothetical protein
MLAGLLFVWITGMRVKSILSALALIALPAGAAASGFVYNADTWLALPPQARQAYAQGINDAANYIYVTDDVGAAVVKFARTRCLIEQKTTAAILADRITMAYTTEPMFKSVPPNIVYFAKMAVYCRDIIAQERDRMGLPPG